MESIFITTYFQSRVNEWFQTHQNGRSTKRRRWSVETEHFFKIMLRFICIKFPTSNRAKELSYTFLSLWQHFAYYSSSSWLRQPNSAKLIMIKFFDRQSRFLITNLFEQCTLDRAPVLIFLYSNKMSKCVLERHLTDSTKNKRDRYRR